MQELTPRQREILSFIADAAAEGASPTIRDICDRFGMTSTNAAMDHVAILRRKGYLRIAPGAPARAVRVVGEAMRHELPANVAEELTDLLTSAAWCALNHQVSIGTFIAMAVLIYKDESGTSSPEIEKA